MYTIKLDERQLSILKAAIISDGSLTGQFRKFTSDSVTLSGELIDKYAEMIIEHTAVRDDDELIEHGVWLATIIKAAKDKY